MAFTISTTNDNRTKTGQQMQDYAHNLREEQAVESANQYDVANGREKHIDTTRSHLNEYIKTESVEQAYERLLGTAVAEYNAKQKRKDRMTSVEKEMDKIKESINNKNPQYLAYEMIVQIGDKDNHPNTELANEIFHEFLEQWNSKYPNLDIFQAVIHNDEATPHMHVDYIPLAYNNKRGLSVQNGLRRAYEEMGFSNTTITTTNEQGEEVEVFDRTNGAKAQWIADCNQMLEQICREHGLEIEHPMRGKKIPRMQMDEYKEYKELKAEKEELAIKNNQAKEELKQSQHENLKLNNENENLLSQNHYLSVINQQITEDNEQANKMLADTTNKANLLVEQSNNLLVQVKELDIKKDVMETKCAELEDTTLFLKTVDNIMQEVVEKDIPFESKPEAIFSKKKLYLVPEDELKSMMKCIEVSSVIKDDIKKLDEVAHSLDKRKNSLDEYSKDLYKKQKELDEKEKKLNEKIKNLETLIEQKAKELFNLFLNKYPNVLDLYNRFIKDRRKQLNQSHGFER